MYKFTHEEEKYWSKQSAKHWFLNQNIFITIVAFNKCVFCAVTGAHIKYKENKPKHKLQKT